jgi:hypothetical protein
MEVSKSAVCKAEKLGELITSLPKWAALAIIVWQGSLSVIALSQTGSSAALLTRFGRQASYWEVVCWIGGMLGIFYGLYSRHLLRRQEALGTERLEAMERRLNPVAETTVPKSPADR